MIKDDNVRIFITIPNYLLDYLNYMCEMTGFTKSQIFRMALSDTYIHDDIYKKYVDILRQNVIYNN